MTRLHHVNLGVRAAQLDEEIAFVVEALGYRKLDVTNDDGFVRRWFETDDGTQIHLSVDDDHRAAGMAHVALDCGDQLDEIRQRLEARGCEFTGPNSFGGVTLINVRDPAGNLFELRG